MFLPTAIAAMNITPYPRSYEQLSDEYLQVGELIWDCVLRETNCTQYFFSQYELYRRAFFGKGDPAPTDLNALTKLTISLTTAEPPKSPATGNEEYTLVVNGSGIFVSAYDTYGASRALATLAQLIEEAPGEEYVRGRYSIRPCQIEDGPAYPYRALMVDPSRHFLPLSALRRQVDALALAKMNVLHVHLTDMGATTYVPDDVLGRRLERGSPARGGRFYYSTQDLADLAAYANSLGVHLVLGIAMPDRAGGWAAADADLAAFCPKRGFTALHPLREQTLEMIQAVIEELSEAVYARIRKAPLLHLGGDGVDVDCWAEDVELQKQLLAQGDTNESAWAFFHSRVGMAAEMAARAGARPLRSSQISKNASTDVESEFIRFYWQEAFEAGNNVTGAVVQTRERHAEVAGAAAAAGAFIVRSDGWELDIRQPGEVRYNF